MTNRTNSWSARSDWRPRQRSLGSAFRAAFPELCVWPELRRSPPWLAAEEVLDLGALWLVIDKEKRVEVPHAFSQALHRAGKVVAVERLADAKTDRFQVEVAVAQHKHPAGGPSIPSDYGVEQDVRRHDRDAGNLTNGLKGLHFDGVRPPWSLRLRLRNHTGLVCWRAKP